jgi:uncharacterized protein DUF3303
MKYVVSWKVRPGGSAADNEAAIQRSLDVFAKWSPPSDSTFHQFLTTLDGEGGYAVVETDNPASVLEGPAKFGPYFEFSVVPCLDVLDGVKLFWEGVEFRKGV